MKVVTAILALSLVAPAFAESPVTLETVRKRVVELHLTPKKTSEAKDEIKKHKIQEYRGRLLCSGAFIDQLGDIITARHCVAEMDEIEVQTSDGKTYSAGVIAVSPLHDLALIHIDTLSPDYFQPAKSLGQGQQIFILGSPLGVTASLSSGIVAKLDGDLTFVDCSVLPGNSGSAVWDSEGNLVGVATAGFIVGFGTTHLNILQSREAVIFFIYQTLLGGNR